MEAGDTGGSAPSELARALEVVEVEVARRIVPAERAIMLRRVSRSMRAAMAVIQPAGVIRVKSEQGQEVMASKKKIHARRAHACGCCPGLGFVAWFH